MNSALQSLPRRAVRSAICAARYQSLSLPQPTTSISRQQRRLRSDDSEWQAIPLTGYYAELLQDPVTPATQTIPEPPPAESLPKTEKEETLQKARIVFGSRLAGPVERRSEIDAKSQNIAGIMVPQRPTEPDNCCMSGCVNCVWDVYRDDIEEWAMKSAQAREKLQAQRASGNGSGNMLQDGVPSHVATSMDDDGGGSETNWEEAMDFGVEGRGLFDDIPVGIREFMRTEKMLKTKHSQDSTLGG